jgi:hypothetical protein
MATRAQPGRDGALLRIAHYVQHPVQKQGRPVPNQRSGQADRLRNPSLLLARRPNGQTTGDRWGPPLSQRAKRSLEIQAL